MEMLGEGFELQNVMPGARLQRGIVDADGDRTLRVSRALRTPHCWYGVVGGKGGGPMDVFAAPDGVSVLLTFEGQHLDALGRLKCMSCVTCPGLREFPLFAGSFTFVMS